MRYIIFSLFTLFSASVLAQTVRTHAGMQYKGSGSYTGYRNNHKDTVLFSAPMGIEVDTAGRIYVSNEHNLFWIHSDRAFLAAGYALDPSDPGAADSKDLAGSQARFSRPAGIAINPNTNELLIADLDNNQIRKMERYINNSTQQIVSTFAGVKQLNGSFLDGATTSAKFNQPVGIAVAPNGDVYLADRANHCIRKISNGTVSTFAGSAGNSGHVNGMGTAAKFSAPFNVFIDGNFLLVADYGNSAIRKIDMSTGAVTDLITTGLFGPKDICKVGTSLFIAEALCVKRYDNNVLSLYVGSNSQQGYIDADGVSARFEDITGIVYHPKQNLIFVVDMGNNVVRSISPNLRPVCSFTASSTTATKGQTVILTSTSTSLPDTYKWTISPASYTLLNGSTINDSLIYLSFSQSGTYNIKLYVSNSSGADSLLKNSYIAISSVTAPPVADFMATKTTPIVDEVISLIDLSTNTPTSWIWRITPVNYIWMNGTDSNSKIPNVKFTNGDNFTITLIATNDEGSTQKTKVDYIKVNGTGLVQVKNTSSLTVYPNPANNFIQIKDAFGAEIIVTDMYGREMMRVSSLEELAELNVSELNSGIYTITLSKNGKNSSCSIVINH
ncbi:MAG: T9SS type A sorting domain-containing protein [Bacteroidia bacterium]|nr:T9SS type A sorting domain-containing protein [Bacteroidia bacterium]